MSPTGRHAVEWKRTRNPWAGGNPWIRTHPLRMYALGAASPWLRPPARFVIVTPGRSGSELLTDLLNSHPDIACEAEILRDRLALPEQFVAGRASKAGLGGAQAYGFKVHCGHFGYQVLRERPGFVREMADSGTQVIFLRRENFLAQAISSTIAARTQWHWRQTDAAAFTPLEIDPVEVLMMTYLFEESDHYLATMLDGIAHLSLTYDRDLVDGATQRATTDRICAELGLSPAPTSSDHVRFTPRRLSETIANFDSVADVIRPTRFRPFLDEAHDIDDAESDDAEDAEADDVEAAAAAVAAAAAAATEAASEAEADAPTS
jgi:hypothetical protein